ncbi:hypothetical protein GWK41_00850 [Persephonella atlantica]|uniref:Oxygen tolerance n=1 Tax=Persephonella atlantica TaxID=2699429 RepID=A0ABS1GFB0_9AQUI|nr:hypothetical protein [Persephonella atlantica]MBK3331609.1 hypothetical protein [Persephonella atlantica]
MLRKISAILLLIIAFAHGYQIDYKLFRLEVIPFYPAKAPLYEKEPVFVRFDVHIKQNKTGIKKEILLKSIKIKPYGEKVISYSQKRHIHPEEKKLTVKNVVYYKTGYNRLRFLLWFDTKKLKNFLSQETLKLLSKENVLENKQAVYISEIPYDTPYIGSFDINMQLKGKKGIATLTIEITGKGFPHVPDYRLIVKNGTSKKIGFSIDSSMGYIKSVQKFKISYLEEMEVLPVTFRFFDPYQGKMREIKTKTLRITPPVNTKKQIKPLSEEEKTRLYIKKFKHLHPELFEEISPYEKLLNFLLHYRHHILISAGLILIVSLVFLKRLTEKYISPSVREIARLELKSIDGFKKLYRYLPEKHMEEYLSIIDRLTFRSEIKQLKGRILYIKSGEEKFTPEKIIKTFEEIKWKIIDEHIRRSSKKKRIITRLYYLLGRYSDAVFSLGFLIVITGFIQFFIRNFPQHTEPLILINIAVIVAFLFYMGIFRKKSIKVSDVRTAE